MPGFPRETPWTDAKRVRLGVLRASGALTGEIAKQLQLSPSQVLREARRQNLPKRPSPIKPKVTP